MNNETKQTAVEWQFEQLFNSFEKFNNDEEKLNEYLKRNLEIRKQAKEMEKEQHGVTFHVGVQWIQYQMDSIHGCLEYWDKEPPDFETFYNETYEGNK